MRSRLARVLIALFTILATSTTVAGPPRSAEGANNGPRGPAVAFSQLLARDTPDTRVKRVTDEQKGDRFEAEWLSSGRKVEFPVGADGWTTLWAEPQRSVSYRPVGAGPALATATGSGVSYQGAWDGADVEAQVEVGKYKETIVLPVQPPRNTWAFEVKLTNLLASQDADVISFGLPDTPLLQIRDLVARDSAGAETKVKTLLRSAGERTFIDLEVDREWLAAAAYPVRIDPTTIATWSWPGHWSGSMIAGDQAGRLMAVLGDSVYYSLDKGNTWTLLTTLDCYVSSSITADNNGNFYVLYSGTPAYPFLRWRLKKMTWTGSTWTVGSPLDVCTNDVFMQDGCAAYWDPKYNNVLLMYSRVYGSYGPAEWDWRYFRVATNTFGPVNQLDYTSGGVSGWATPAYGSAVADDNSGTAYFVWQGLNLSGARLVRYTTSDGNTYLQESSANLGSCESVTAAVRADGNVVVGKYEPLSYLSVATYYPATNTSNTITLETSDIGFVRPAITNASGDLYLYFAGSGGNIYYRKYKQSTGVWQARTTLQTGSYETPSTDPRYLASDGAWVVWKNTATNEIVFGGVVLPKPPNAPSNLNPGGGSWVNSTTPRLAWTYSNPDPTDTQAAYQVQVKNSLGTVIKDTGKTTSPSQYYDIPPSTLTAGTTYTWAVTTWDTRGDLQGPWSTWQAFGIDTTVPTVSASINGGAPYTASTSVTMNISASDSPSGPAQMDFTYKGATTSWEPYATSKSFTLTTPDGLQTVTTNVKDAAGNVGSSAATITLDTTPPTVSVTAPTSGATVGGLVPLRADAADAIAMQNVSFYRDGALIGSVAASPWQVTWDTSQLAAGPAALTAVARDMAGNTRTSAPVNVTVDNTPPSVSITAPTQGETVRGIRTLNATASCNSGVGKVEYYVDGGLVGSATAPPYAVQWNSAGVANGPHSLAAKAYNNYGLVGASTLVAITVDNSPVTGTLAAETGSTSGPGGSLNLRSTSTWAVTWSGLDYKLASDTTWTNHQSGSGTFNAGAATIPWTVPTAPAPWQVRVGLVDAQGSSGYTDTLELVLPAAPSLTVAAGPQGDITVNLPTPGAGITYTVSRSSSSSFAPGATDEIAAGSTATSLRDGMNLVPNSGFEWGIAADGTPKSWSRLGTSSTLSMDSAVRVAPGQYAVRLDKADAGSGDGIVETAFSGRGLAGRQMTLSGWLRTQAISTGTGSGAWLQLEFLSRDGGVLGTATTTALTGTNDWQRYSVSTVVPDGTYAIRAAVLFGLSTGTLWADGIQVEPGPRLSAYAPGALSDMTTYYYRAATWSGPLHSDYSNTASVIYRGLPAELGRGNLGSR